MGERGSLLGELVDSWLAVVESSQSYLVEAVERLVVDHHVAAKAVQVNWSIHLNFKWVFGTTVVHGFQIIFRHHK